MKEEKEEKEEKKNKEKERRRKAQARGPLEACRLLAGLKELHLEQFEFLAGSWILV